MGSSQRLSGLLVVSLWFFILLCMSRVYQCARSPKLRPIPENPQTVGMLTDGPVNGLPESSMHIWRSWPGSPKLRPIPENPRTLGGDIPTLTCQRAECTSGVYGPVRPRCDQSLYPAGGNRSSLDSGVAFGIYFQSYGPAHTRHEGVSPSSVLNESWCNLTSFSRWF